MKFITQPISQQDAHEIATWQYETPYSIYSLSKKDIPVLLNADNRYFRVQDESGQLMGYCCFGEEAKVPGGEYIDSEPHVIDVGLGMHPKIVGKGLGKAFVVAILRFATEQFKPKRFRVSIAEFNKRSQITFSRLGFMKTYNFNREGDGMRFVQFEREANWIG